MDSSPLAHLPAELRNEIWEYAVYSDDIDISIQEPALLQTCKRVRNETRKVFYAINDFTIRLPPPVKRSPEDEYGFLKPSGVAWGEIDKIRRLSRNRLDRILPLTVVFEAVMHTPVQGSVTWTFAEEDYVKISQALVEKGFKEGDVAWVVECLEGTPDIIDAGTNSSKKACMEQWKEVMERALAGTFEEQWYWVERLSTGRE